MKKFFFCVCVCLCISFIYFPSSDERTVTSGKTFEEKHFSSLIKTICIAFQFPGNLSRCARILCKKKKKNIENPKDTEKLQNSQNRSIRPLQLPLPLIPSDSLLKFVYHLRHVIKPSSIDNVIKFGAFAHISIHKGTHFYYRDVTQNAFNFVHAFFFALRMPTLRLINDYITMQPWIRNRQYNVLWHASRRKEMSCIDIGHSSFYLQAVHIHIMELIISH